LDFSPVIFAIPLFFILIIVELIYEYATNKWTYRLNDAITNINLGSLDQVSGIFSKILKIGIYTFLFEHFAFFSFEASWTSFAILFVLYDLCYYWSHRMAHTISLFWGGHVVHHQSEDYNLSVALRQSSTQFLWSLPFYLPLALIGFSPMQFVFVLGWNLIYQFWIHTEHIGKLPRWVEFIMNTPSHHRVHHARDPKYIDKNYAGVFIIWDRIFGSFKKEEEKPHYGITKPLKSWNPVYANFAHYIDLFKSAAKAKSIVDGFKIFFYRPGWQPDYMGGYIAPFPVDDTYQKFDTSKNYKRYLFYIFFQFLFALGLISFFLFNQESLNNSLILLFIVWFLITIVMFSFYFESSGGSLFFLEIIRLSIIPYGFIRYYEIFSSTKGIISWILIVYAFSSIIWFYFIIKTKQAAIKNPE
jgi:sterol desaturase/sphingolipid hydroxylase (fatty acid hydroxylase superfamily)